MSVAATADIGKSQPQPTFENFMGGTLVTIPRNATAQQIGTKDGTKELTERQLFIVDCLRNDGTINIPDLALKIKAGERTIKRDIALLQKNGILKRIGSRKDGHWEVDI